MWWMTTIRSGWRHWGGRVFLSTLGIVLVFVGSQDIRRIDAAETVQEGQVSLQHSRVYIHVDKSGPLGHEHAVEGRLKSGTLRMDGSPNFGELVFDMTSFVADGPNARKYIGLGGTTDPSTQSKVTANMVGPDVLDVRRYPTAKFAITAITPLKDKSRRGLPQYRIDGQFTLCSKTRHIQITADAEPKDGWLQLRGGFPIQQTHYGITPYSIGFGAVGVADRLQIWGDLWVAHPNSVAKQPTGSPIR